MTTPNGLSRPLAVGVVRSKITDDVVTLRGAAVQLALQANTLGYAIVFVFHTVGDRSHDVHIYEQIEHLARRIDAQALIVTAGNDRRTLGAIADRVRMRVHVLRDGD